MSATPSFGLIEETADLITGFEVDVGKTVTGGWSSSWTTYIQLFYSEFDSIRTIVQNLKVAKYKDCYILLRSVLEYYFVLLLMIRGRRYRETRDYHVIADASTVREARDKTFEKWESDRKFGKLNPIVKAINKGHKDDVIHVTIETEGLYEEKDVEKKGAPIPMYYFVFDQYDPDVNFLAELPTLYKPGHEFTKIVERHKRLYSQYLYVEKIADNLLLNNLLTKEQLDRFWVHYNFLSSFTHPTRRGVMDIQSMTYSAEANQRRNDIHEELLLHYLAHLEAMLIRLVGGFFADIISADLKIYLVQAEKLESHSKNFWFICNEPTSYDLMQSDTSKRYMTIQGMQVPHGVLYYRDPVERMRNIIWNRKA
jgi:hypothetical protein